MRTALVQCRDCGTEISRKAETCPRCGRPGPVATGMIGESVGAFGWIILLIFAAIVAVVVAHTVEILSS